MGDSHQLSAQAARRAGPAQAMSALPAAARRLGAVLLLALAGASSAAQAASASFSGSFATDDQLAMIRIGVPVAGDITVQTFSYGGGTNGANQVIPPGGFAPVLTLFDEAGNNVIGNVGSSNTCPPGGAGFCWDASFTYPGAPAGDYLLVLSQDGNYPVGQFPDGFSMAGQPHYTAQYAGFPDDPHYTFIQIDGSQRSGGWALDVSAPGPLTLVPEPTVAALLAAGLAIVGLARRRSRSGAGPLRTAAEPVALRHPTQRRTR